MRLTVANWNIWGRAAAFETRYPDIVSALGEVSADIVGLVEVWRDGDALQVEALAEALGYPHSAYAEVDAGARSGEPWGVGILSRLPIHDQLRVAFPNASSYPQSPGAALVTTVRSEQGLLDVVCLCEWGLSWSGYGGGDGGSDRLASYQFLARLLLDRKREIAPIVVGDFNNVPESRDLRALTGKDLHGSLAMTFMDAWEFTHGGAGWTFDGLANAHLRARPFGRHRIDYILTGTGRGFRGLWRANDALVFGQTGASGMPPSDHYGVRAELELVGLFGELPVAGGD